MQIFSAQEKEEGNYPLLPETRVMKYDN